MVDPFERNERKSVWGPIYWKFLHQHILSTYPVTASWADKRAMKRWLTVEYPNMLPCPTCRASMKSYMNRHSTKLDAALKGRLTLAPFVYAFHNAKRVELGKDQRGSPMWSWQKYLTEYGAGAKLPRRNAVNTGMPQFDWINIRDMIR